MTRRTRIARDLSGAFLGSTSTTLAVSLVGALAVQMRASLHLSLGALGEAISLYYLAASVGSVPASRIAERFGSTRTIRAGASGAALVLLTVAFAARSFVSLVSIMLVAGLVSSFMPPATNRFLIRRMPDTRQGTAFGIKQSAVPFAAVLAGLAVPAVGLTVGWRWAFVLGAVVAAVAAGLAPRRHENRNPRPAVRRGGSGAELGALVVLAIGFGLGVLAASGLSAFLVMSEVASGIGKASAGLVAALAGAASVAARVAAGVRADHRGRAHLAVVALMLSAGVGGYVILAAGSATGIVALVVVGALVAYGAGWGWNGLFNFAIARSHSDAPARATGVTQVAGRMAGVIGPITFSLVVAHSSFAVGWMMCAGCALVGAVVIAVGRHVLADVRSAAGGRVVPGSDQGPG